MPFGLVDEASASMRLASKRSSAGTESKREYHRAPMKKRTKREAAPEWVSQITALRDRLGITQAELARRLTCSAITIARWERGLHTASAEHFRRLVNLRHRTET